MKIEKEVKIYSTGFEHHFFFDGKKHGGFSTKEKAKKAAKEMNRARKAGGKKKIATGKLEIRKGLWFEELKKKKATATHNSKGEKKDRCARLADKKYGMKGSAYKSGYMVQCRRGKVSRKK